MNENDDMPIDADLDLLESYLDDALDPAGAAAVRVRLAADAGLSATLDRLRAERAGRAAAWASLEPDARAVDQLCWRVRGAVAAERSPPAAMRPRWESFLPDPWRVTRFTSAAAACVLLGFFGGRLGRGPTPPPPSVAVTDQPAMVAAGSPMDGPPAVADGPVEVPITDEYGRLVASQKFRTADEARRFLDDLHRARDGSAAAVDGPVRTVSELRY